MGKGYLSKLFPNVAKSVANKIGTSTVAKVAQGMIGEGAEEVVSELIRPKLELMIKDKEEIQPATLESCLESFTIGALASGIIQGGSIKIQNTYVNTLKTQLQDIEAQEQKAIQDKTITPQMALEFTDQKQGILDALVKLGVNTQETNKNATIEENSTVKGNIETNQQTNIQQTETNAPIPNIQENSTLKVNDTQIDIKTENAPANTSRALIQDDKGNYTVKDYSVEQDLDYDLKLIKDSDGKYNVLIKDGITLRNKSDSKATMLNIVNQLKNEGQLEYVSKSMYDNALKQGRVNQFNTLNAQTPNQTNANNTQVGMANNTVNNKANDTPVKASDKVMTSIPDQTPKKTFKQKVKDFYKDFTVNFLDAQAEIVTELKRLGNTKAEAIANNARSGSNSGQSLLVDGQFDSNYKRIGKSLKDIFSFTNNKFKGNKAQTQQYKQDFNEYLLHYHNLERSIQDKPVFDVNITANDSQARINELEAKYPEFKQHAQEVWTYCDNLLKYRVDTGLITPLAYSLMKASYPHYVPTYRYGKGGNPSSGLNSISGINNQVKSAKGGNQVILPVDVQIARMTMGVVKAAKLNQMALALYEGAEKTQDHTNVDIREKEDITDIKDIDYEEQIVDNIISFYKDGKKISMAVNDNIATGFKALRNNPNEKALDHLINGASKVTDTFKKLVTNLNPYFLFRNGIKDLQEAGLYTKYGKAFTKNYVKAFNEIRSNGEYWQKYKAMGGLHASIFNFNTGIIEENTNNILSKIEQANMIVESMPRLAEFISSLEANNSMEQALLDANDITVNFGRSGIFVKKLNNSVMPFLNASIQGFSKMTRTVIDVKSKRQMGSLLMKATLLGIAPSVLNNLLWGDDDEYEALRQVDKDNNYILFKVNGQFLKVPKGRAFSVLSGLYNRTLNTLKGENDAFNGFAKNVENQISPVNNFRFIWSPLNDVKSNTTWYGGQIESGRFDNIRPSDRYDETTSSIAIELGKMFDYSPKKIHYLIDQYSGIIGDVLIPMTTKKAEGSVLAKNLLIDPTTANKYSEQFYNVLEKETFNKTDGDMVAKAKVKYLNRIKNDLSTMYQQQKDLQASTLSDDEKKKQNDIIQTVINNSLKQGLENVNVFAETLQRFELSPLSFEDDYREATRLTFGADIALKEYDKKVYEKATNLSLANINYDTFYSAYFDCKELEGELDDNGEVVNGSRKKQVYSYIEKLPISQTQKYILFGSLGYKSTKGEEAVKSYVSSLKISNEEKQMILKSCNYD
jgi:hypothetical protein